MSPESVENLINQAKNGDKVAFSSLYTELYTPLFRFVKSRTRDHEKSLDICQETFLKWYKSLDNYEIKMKPLSYLMMISMRLIINDTQKKKSLVLDEDSAEFIADESLVSASDTFDFDLDFNKVKELFEDLNENQKNVLTMRFIADADTESIAETMEISIENVRQIESRGLKKLRELYFNKYGNLVLNKES
jgi:RNA polymerase sigma-70 factor (ECF subfamily)